MLCFEHDERTIFCYENLHVFILFCFIFTAVNEEEKKREKENEEEKKKVMSLYYQQIYSLDSSLNGGISTLQNLENLIEASKYQSYIYSKMPCQQICFSLFKVATICSRR